ncbi:MAG: hypothetical protein ABSC53_07220 [Bacteroidota bacterium]
MKVVRMVLLIVFFVFGIGCSKVAYDLSQKVETGQPGGYSVDSDNGDKGGYGVAIGAGGGALGFCILAGMCFCCCTYLSKP